MKEPHTCIARDARGWQEAMPKMADHSLTNNMEWREFTVPLPEITRAWRAYCGILVREAHRRGLPIPERRTA